MAKTNAQRQSEWRKRQSVRGMVLKQVWVNPKHWPAIEAAITKIQEKG